MFRASKVWPLVAAAVVIVACGRPLPTGTSVSAAGLQFVAPPGWTARLDPPASTGAAALLGWATNQVPLPTCTGACQHPIDRLEAGGLIVWVQRVSCLPNCQLPDAGRVLIGGREATRQEITGPVCGGLGNGVANPGVAEAIVASVTPQRHDVFLVCAGSRAEAARSDLDRLLASVTWTIP
jgi:hypothetical protein